MGNERPTLYAGMTNNLFRRVQEHKGDVVEGFTKKYKLHKLLYFECGENPLSAIIREKQVKNMSRKEKLELITEQNPDFVDLYASLFDENDLLPPPDSGQAGMTTTRNIVKPAKANMKNNSDVSNSNHSGMTIFESASSSTRKKENLTPLSSQKP